jgi:hypothetical protein
VYPADRHRGVRDECPCHGRPWSMAARTSRSVSLAFERRRIRC